MLKSCQYCGRIHEKSFDCGRKPKKIQYSNEKTGFRSTYAWTEKSKKIRKRDRYICQCCIRKYPGTERIINYEDIEVHHIEPLEEDYECRLDNENLISLCRTHHEDAEAGKISRTELHEIAKEQERY